MTERAQVARLRRRAAKLGYRIEKSNWRRDTIDNLGGFRIVEISRNIVLDGSRFDLELDYVQVWLEEREEEAA